MSSRLEALLHLGAMSVAEPLEPEARAHAGAHDAHGFTIRSPLPSASAAHRTRGSPPQPQPQPPQPQPQPPPQPQPGGLQPSAARSVPASPGRAPGTPGVPRVRTPQRTAGARVASACAAAAQAATAAVRDSPAAGGGKTCYTSLLDEYIIRSSTRPSRAGTPGGRQASTPSRR